MSQFRALDRLAFHQRDRLGMIGSPHDREAEIGLETLLVEVQRDQPPADQMCEQRADARIQQVPPRSASRESCTLAEAGMGVVAESPHRMYAKENSATMLPSSPVASSSVRWIKR